MVVVVVVVSFQIVTYPKFLKRKNDSNFLFLQNFSPTIFYTLPTGSERSHYDPVSFVNVIYLVGRLFSTINFIT